jgi:hypothetical protein
LLTFPQNIEENNRTQKHPVSAQNTTLGDIQTFPNLHGLAHAEIEAPGKIIEEAELKINRLEGKFDEKFKSLEKKLLVGDEKFKTLEEKLSAVDEKLKTLEARMERRWTEIFPNYFMVVLTLGIAIFTGVLMWYLSKGTTDKTLAGTEEVIKNGFKTFNDFLSMYLSIVKDRTREGTTTLVGSLSQVPKSVEELPQCSSNE